MIPDKIYIGVGTLSSIQPAEEYPFPGWQEKPYSQVRSVAYIRKEALIEWANEQIKVAKVNNLAYSPFEKLVDKLNSM